MIILIDGYNYARFFFSASYSRDSLEHKKMLDDFAEYATRKRGVVKKVCVVFDGGLFNHSDHERYKSIVVLHAGAGRSADDAIVDLAQHYKGYEVVVVTNDRELSRRCNVFGAEHYSVADFNVFVRSYEKKSSGSVSGGGSITKTTSENDSEVDALMYEASAGNVIKQEDEKTRSASSGARRSKHERKRDYFDEKLC